MRKKIWGGVDYDILKNLTKSKISSITNNNIFSKIPKEIIELYTINYKINNKILSIDEAIKFLDNIRVNFDKYSRNSIIFIFVEMFEYFESLNEWNYFLKARDNVSNLLNYRFLNTKGALKFFNKFTNIYNTYCNKNNDIRVAIMIAGAYRGHYEHCLQSTIEFAKSLNADIFISSWDKVFCYPGLGGAGGNYIDRNFNSIKSDCPKIILNKPGLRRYFPNLFEILNKEIAKPIYEDYFFNFKNVKNCVLKSDIKFENMMTNKYKNQIKNITKEQAQTHSEIYFINICKQFYHFLNCKDMILQYESKNNFKYDYIIKLRPDSKPEILEKSELFKLKPNEIAVNLVGGIGVADGVFYGKRDEILKFINIYKFDENQDFKYFTNMFRVGGVHGLLLDWLMFNELKITPMRIHAPTETKFHISILPDFNDALSKDIKNSNLNQKELQECLNFFNKIRLLIENNNIEIKKIYPIKCISTAKSRIHNQLSYKLGQAMIENSKSIWGYIRMPYVLSYIKDMHKKEQIAYNEKIKANPNLKLPPLESYPDYKEALKEKECLTYKLGEAMIEASKNWYKGGYVKFIFKAIRLKEKYMKK